ncbi:hypothetical protein YC2023_023327 [Brassica napus]
MFIIPFYGSNVTTWNLQRHRENQPHAVYIHKKIKKHRFQNDHAYVQAVEDTLTSRLFRQDFVISQLSMCHTIEFAKDDSYFVIRINTSDSRFETGIRIRTLWNLTESRFQNAYKIFSLKTRWKLTIPFWNQASVLKKNTMFDSVRNEARYMNLEEACETGSDIDGHVQQGDEDTAPFQQPAVHKFPNHMNSNHSPSLTARFLVQKFS